jgi:hypothetical protein
MTDVNRKPNERSERSKQAILDPTREVLEESDVRSLTVEFWLCEPGPSARAADSCTGAEEARPHPLPKPIPAGFPGWRAAERRDLRRRDRA